MDTTNHIYFRTKSELRKWLEKNCLISKGLWLVFDKGSTRTLSYDDIVGELLCFGWIDSKPGIVDSEKSKLWIAPRNPKSNWSKINKDRIEQLLLLKKIMPSGLTLISEAKKNGAWDKLNDVDKLVIPQDLTREFEKYTLAKDNFNLFPKSVKRGILEWILNAKKDETRQKRIQETAVLAQKNERANQWRK